ncbi:MAG: DNA methyltransferase [Candidatus Micrarchaeaceae archaeon]
MNTLDREEILRCVLNAQDTTYLTHNFHPFPAKFIPQIPNLMIKRFSQRNETVFDPFCGSGTTLVEAKLLERNSYGVDIHPLGVFMTKVKTTKIAEEELKKVPDILKIIERRVDIFVAKNQKWKTLLAFTGELAEVEKFHYTLPNFPNRDHWFQEHVLHELSIINSSIMEANVNPDLRDLLLLAFSCIIVPVSNQDSETRYAAIKKEIPPKQPFLLFKEKVLDMVNRIKAFNQRASDCEAKAYHADSRELNFLDENIADLIVTSPPYPNTYDYYLYHKLRMFWLKMDWERAKFNEIGSRLRHSSQREPIDTYMKDMTKCFEHFGRILKPGKPFVIVVGDSIIQKELIKGDEVIGELADKTGFKVEDKIEYNLSYASKTFNPAFRNKIKQEHIILLRNEK